MDSFILCGMQFGDEGKGTFVDYLAYKENIDGIVKYNGGSQASHTVITPTSVLHKFSQLGSGMFLEKCHTYITENMVINLDNLIVEMNIFSEKTNIPIIDLMNRIHIHENCYIVTPYHKLINKLRELSKGKNRRGTVGTGVSEVMYLLNNVPKQYPYESNLGLQVKDIYNPYSNNPIFGKLESLQNYVNKFYIQNKDIIWENIDEDIKESLVKEIDYLLAPKAFLKISANYIDKFKNSYMGLVFKKCIYNQYENTFRISCNKVIFEGSQGLLIDKTYGIKPNTTYLDTTNKFALDISWYRDNIHKIGITKAFSSRHGFGIFPTESSEVNDVITDNNQDKSFWNGQIRFGWFDAVLLRYAQKINQVDEMYLSSLDKLDKFDEIKVCDKYIYTGKIDEKFKEIFDYEILSDEIIINNINKNDEKLIDYLKECISSYITVKGWKKDISKILKKEELPSKCLEYIKLLEETINIPITVISVGPTRNNKIQIKEEAVL